MRWRWAIQASSATRRRSATPWATSSAAAGANAIASLASRLCGVARGAPARVAVAGRRVADGAAARAGACSDLREQAAGRVHAEARRAAQHGLAVGVQRVVAPERARPEVRGAGVVGDLGRSGRDLVVGIVHAVGRVPGRPAPDAPRPAEALVAGGIHAPRGLVGAGLELHRAEHAARVRDVGARVATVARLDRADRGQQLPGHAVGAAPLLVQRQVVARECSRRPRRASRASLQAACAPAGAAMAQSGEQRRRPAWRYQLAQLRFRQKASPT